ncbi:hypothetical protein FOZ62_024405, partial [Perkinsus olseni]
MMAHDEKGACNEEIINRITGKGDDNHHDESNRGCCNEHNARMYSDATGADYDGTMI